MRYSKYPSYRDSGVEWLGEIPNEWEPSKLKYCLSSIVAGGTPKTTTAEYWCDSGDGVPWVSIADMTKNDIVQKTKKDVTREGISDKGLKILTQGTILYSIFASLGKVAIAGTNLTTNQAILGLVPNNKINKSFFYWVLIALEGYVKYMASSNTQDNLNAEKVANFPVTLPLQEQQTIANYLDIATAKIDTLIEKQTKLIELLREKRQAVISTAVTRGLDNTVAMKDSGVEWLGEIPEHWTICKIKHYGVYRSGDFISADNIEPRGTYPVLGGNGLRGYTDTYNLRGTYVLIGRQGALCGNINYSESKVWATEHAIVVYNNKNIDVKWLGEFLRNMNLNQYSVSAAQPGLAVENIINLQGVQPPLKEQKEIGIYIEEQSKKIDTLITKSTKAIDLLKEKRTALISAAVTGKIDIREIA